MIFFVVVIFKLDVGCTGMFNGLLIYRIAILVLDSFTLCVADNLIFSSHFSLHLVFLVTYLATILAVNQTMFLGLLLLATSFGYSND